MKKFMLSAAISFLLLFPLAAKNLDFYWDFGTVFAGGNLAFNNPSDGKGQPAAVKLFGEFDAQLLDFRLEGENGFLLAFSPFNFRGIFNSPKDDDSSLVTFANLTIGYELFKFQENVELIPYLTLYAVALEGMEKVRFDFGLLFNLYSASIWPDEIRAADETHHLRGEILAVKAGVRLNQLQPQLYVDLGFNAIALGMAFFQNK